MKKNKTDYILKLGLVMGIVLILMIIFAFIIVPIKLNHEFNRQIEQCKEQAIRQNLTYEGIGGAFQYACFGKDKENNIIRIY